MRKNELVKLILDQAIQIQALQEILNGQQKNSQQLRDEIARLKGQKPKPKIKPSKMDKGTEPKSNDQNKNGKRPGSQKRRKTKEVKIHHTETIPPTQLPEGARFKGYSTYVVQGLRFQAHNTLYQLERWQLPDGRYISGQLPREVKGSHYDKNLEQYVIYQHHHCNVTQPLLLEQLREIGIDISSGQINHILMEDHDKFHEEKDAVYRAGVRVCDYITVDDTGCRHQGKNGYTTHIGSALFAWFSSSKSKSRVNFLELLQKSTQTGYKITEYSLSYMNDKGLKASMIETLARYRDDSFSDKQAWQAHLASLGIQTKNHMRIATEGALLGHIVSEGMLNELPIISDDAGQFNVLTHALCWIHAERTIHKLLAIDDSHQAAIDSVRSEIWDYYAALKHYKQGHDNKTKLKLEKQFDEIFTQKTAYQTLNKALKRLHNNKTELLMVLLRPHIPLHTNDSEQDIRGVVGKRKVSGGTRSDLGQRCRDTFATLKRTCRRNSLSFWDYLGDRLSGKNIIPPLAHIIEQNALA